MDNFTNIWINKTKEPFGETFSLSFRMKYEKHFEHLPVIHTSVWQSKKAEKKNLRDCTDDEKEFHTNIGTLSRNQLIDLYEIIGNALRSNVCGIIKLDK